MVTLYLLWFFVSFEPKIGEGSDETFVILIFDSVCFRKSSNDSVLNSCSFSSSSSSFESDSPSELSLESSSDESSAESPFESSESEESSEEPSSLKEGPSSEDESSEVPSDELLEESPYELSSEDESPVSSEPESSPPNDGASSASLRSSLILSSRSFITRIITVLRINLRYSRTFWSSGRLSNRILIPGLSQKDSSPRSNPVSYRRSSP